MQADWRTSTVQDPGQNPRRAGKVKLLDLNLLPVRYRPRRPTFADVAPVVATIGLVLLLVPVVDRLQVANQTYLSIRSELSHQRSVLSGGSEVEARIDQAEADLDSIQEELNGLVASYDVFRIQDVAWNAYLGTVASATPRDTRLLRVDQSGELIRLQGECTEHQLVILYAKALAELPGVESVAVERIDRIDVPVQGTDGEEALVASTVTSYTFEFLLTMDGSNSLDSPGSADAASSGSSAE